MVLTMFTTLFSVVNPLGAMPLFLALTTDNTNSERNKQALKASIYVTVILIVAFLVGDYILQFFSISIEGMRIAAGILLMASGQNLLNATYKEGRSIDDRVEAEASVKEDISFFPLALPMLSGPGSISLLIGMAAEMDSTYTQYLWVFLAIIMTSFAVFGILFLSPKLTKVLGRTGIVVMSKLMGFIVLTVGIQYIINGVLPILESVGFVLR